ncbi:hypothetical protein ACVWWN_003700 [Mycobacterium sp. URHB0021]|jgi:enoyl-CoA hydratase/isomerase-like protein
MLARLIGPVRTRDLMFTGRSLTAHEAREWGMVARVVPHDELLDAARDVLAACCRTASAARSLVKSSLDNYLGLFDRIGMQASYSSREALEGVRAFKKRGHRPGRIPTSNSMDGSDPNIVQHCPRSGTQSVGRDTSWATDSPSSASPTAAWLNTMRLLLGDNRVDR